MDNLLIVPFIETLQGLPPELVSLILFGVCAFTLLLLLKFFGIQGLYIYNIVAILTANIQVLKGTQFSLSAEPVALGTIVFATTYLCSDILTEHFGKEAAKKCIWFCFAAQILMTLLMIIAVGYPPLSVEVAKASNTEYFLEADKALSLLFTPSPRLLLASLLAFVISQFCDIQMFHWLQKLMQQRGLWLRTFLSTSFSAIVDTALFSVLAWVLLATNPVSLKVLIFTYILGTLLTRFILSILSMPILYLSYSFSPLRRSYVS